MSAVSNMNTKVQTEPKNVGNPPNIIPLCISLSL